MNQLLMPDGYDVHKVNEIGHMYEYIMSLTLGMLDHFRKKNWRLLIYISLRVCVCFFHVYHPSVK